MGRIEGGGGGGGSIIGDTTLPNDRGIAVHASATWDQSTYLGTLSGGTVLDDDPIWCLAFWLSSDVSDMAVGITGIDSPMAISREFNTLSMTTPSEVGNNRFPGYKIDIGVIQNTFDVTSFVFTDLTIVNGIALRRERNLDNNVLSDESTDMSQGAMISGKLTLVPTTIYGAAITVSTTSTGNTACSLTDLDVSFVKDLVSRSFIRVVS